MTAETSEHGQRDTTYFLVALLAASSLCAQPGQDEPIRVSTRLVVARTSVIAKDGAFIQGLIASDFRLYDDGRLQSIRVEEQVPPLSIVIAVQSDQGVRQYLPQINKVGSVIETLLVGEGGESAVLSFGDEVNQLQAFTKNGGLVGKALRSISASGSRSRSIDAVLRGSELLAERPPHRRRILVLISQLSDAGSNAKLADALSKVELNDVRVFSIVIPRAGRALVEDTLQVGGTGSGGFRATLNLMKLIPEIYRAGKSASGDDAITVLTAYTGGRRLPFRGLRELETALTKLGEELHSEYAISYTPDNDRLGYHAIRLDVAKPIGALVHTRPGYYRDANLSRP